MFCFFYCQTRGGKANLDNEEDIIDIILFLIFFTIEYILFLCALGTGAIGKSRRWREEKQDTQKLPYNPIHTQGTKYFMMRM